MKRLILADGSVFEYDSEREMYRGGESEIFLGRGFDENSFIIKRFKPHVPRVRYKNYSEILPAISESDYVSNLIGISALNERPFFVIREHIRGYSLMDLFKDEFFKENADCFNEVMWRVGVACLDLHSRGFIHRDLKPHNVILSEDNKLYLIDFTMSVPTSLDLDLSEGIEREVLVQKSEVPIIGAGTFSYCPPEHFKLRVPPVTSLYDSWSWGVSYLRLLAGRLPFVEKCPASFKRAILRNSPRDLDKVDPKFREVVCGALEKKKENRLTMQEIVAEMQWRL